MGETGVCEAVRAVEYESEWVSSPKIRTVWDSSDLILMGLGQESDREGEVVSWEAASSAPGRVAMNCRKVLFAAIAQNFGRQGLHIMTASLRLVHEGCGSGHFTVGGAGVGLRKALAIASDGVHRRQSRALSVASRAGVSLQTQGKCGSGQLGPATDGPGPGGRQRRRGGGLGAGNSASWHLHRDTVTRGLSSVSAHHLAFSVALLAQAHQ